MQALSEGFVPGNTFADIELAWGLRDDNFILTLFVVCGWITAYTRLAIKFFQAHKLGTVGLYPRSVRLVVPTLVVDSVCVNYGEEVYLWISRKLKLQVLQSSAQLLGSIAQDKKT